jgi:hypothetical protein
MANARIPRVAILCLTLAGSSAAGATSVVYSDLATFLADTGAAATAIPDAGGSGVVTSPQTVGPLTFSLGPGATNLIFGGIDWTTRLTGAEIALSGVEDLDVGIASGAFAFGFEMVEPQNDPNLNGTFVDSTFTITLRNGGSIVDSFLLTPPNDTAVFFGVWSSDAFDRVEIRETVGALENEFFGTFYTGSQALPVPEPSGLAFAALALLAGLRATRRIP